MPIYFMEFLYTNIKCRNILETSQTEFSVTKHIVKLTLLSVGSFSLSSVASKNLHTHRAFYTHTHACLHTHAYGKIRSKIYFLN